MRHAIFAAIALTCCAASASAQERPTSTSTTYRACTASAVSLADQRACLSAEVEWGRQAVEAAAQGAGVEAQSQELWRRSAEYDCRGEYELAGGGSSADMRRDACMIEMQADRVDYLLRRVNW